MRERPYGTWPSGLSARTVAEQGLRLGHPQVDGHESYWVEGRPSEGGRNVLVRCRADGTLDDITPPGINVRTRTHEYGGGAYLVADGVVYFSNFTDHRVYRLDLRGPAHPEPLTLPGPWFYADFALDAEHRRLVCVREDHSPGGAEPRNTLVGIPLDGSPSGGEVLVAGHDFFSNPRSSVGGRRLAWLAWRHPQMPWDGTELWIADVNAAGVLENTRLVAGGPDESIYQPGWSPDGTLYFVSDRNDWWQLYRYRGDSVEPVLREPLPEAEFGRPQWIFGTATWSCAGPARLLASYTRRGHWHLASIDLASGRVSDVPFDLEPGEWIASTPTRALLVAASATVPSSIVELDLGTGARRVLRTATSLTLDDGDISLPEEIEFSTDDGEVAHAFYYPPTNRTYAAPDGERPPLIVVNHGGPTTAATPVLDLRLQFWTNRGFAVVDVNYRGSSGYGRRYRRSLNGRWGLADVADTVNIARVLAAAGKADSNRLIARGGSAGGYTTLAALTFHPGAFAAGASYYGVSDLEVLARDTHKFESRYLDTLVGPYPEARELYRARSPIHHVDRLACALILLQGIEDKVVPPNQSQMMADAVRLKGLPVSLLVFEGEQHGFRKADTIVSCLEAELAFYGAVFGFRPADALPPLRIDNLRDGNGR